MTTWVLLRGLARESRHWGEFPLALRRSLPQGDRVLALDLPGNGSFNHERSPWRVAAMVAHAHAQLAALDARPPYLLLALSLGGMVALQWAMEHPQELAACVLVNSSFAGLSPPWARLRPLAAWQLAQVLRPGIGLEERERGVLALTSNRPAAQMPVAHWAAIAATRPTSPANFLRQVVAAARFRLPARAPRVPLHLLASRADRLVAFECSCRLAQAWNLPLAVHAEAGHDLPLDAQDWMLDQLLALVDEEVEISL